jgi:hypothetical protein
VSDPTYYGYAGTGRPFDKVPELRAMLGHVVPEHIDVDVNDSRIRAFCVTCSATFLNERSDPFGSERFGQFIQEHGHGEVPRG